MLLALAVAHGRPAGGATTLRSDAALRRAVEAQGERFVEAVNSDDAAFRKRVVRDIFLPESFANDGEQRLLGLLTRLRETLGTLAFHHAEAVSFGEPPDLRVSLHVYARSGKDGNWRDIQFYLSPETPHRIREIAFLADVAEPVYLPNGEISDPSTLGWLGGYVDRLAGAEDLAGGLLIAAGDRVMFERSVGYADSARRRAITSRTRFNLASGGKMFTALLIARLVEEGRVRFDDTLGTYLAAIPNLPGAGRVTIAQLLSHTSGIGEFWDEEYRRHWGTIRTLRDYLPFVSKAGIRFAPGQRFEYSNSNYILAGLIVEAVTRRPFHEALAERLLKPLGMRDTGLDPFDDADTLQAMRLKRGPVGWTTTDHGYRGSSAGGCLTTMADMLRFARALAAGRIVSPATLREMTTSKTAGLPGAPMEYGFGFILERTPDGRRSYGHGGIAQGVNFEFRYFPDADITLVAFSNQDNGAYDDLRRNTIKLITGQR